MTIADYLREPPNDKIVLFRHDVDRLPQNSVKSAEIEHRLGIRATYYFRMIPGIFKPRLIRQVAALGHEIGYHYETLSQAKGKVDNAWLLFRRNLAHLRKIAPIETISMHGRPFSPHDNREIWKTYDFREAGIRGEAYLSLDYSRIAYFTDTGRIWNNTKFNIRDQVKGPALPEFRNTRQMLKYIKNTGHQTICILTHPNRWSETAPEWIWNLLSDWLVNGAKLGIKQIRKKH